MAPKADGGSATQPMYDLYMRRVLEGLERGESEESLIEYLVGIEVDHMGLNLTADTRVRAEATIAAISRPS